MQTLGAEVKEVKPPFPQVLLLLDSYQLVKERSRVQFYLKKFENLKKELCLWQLTENWEA